MKEGHRTGCGSEGGSDFGFEGEGLTILRGVERRGESVVDALLTTCATALEVLVRQLPLPP